MANPEKLQRIPLPIQKVRWARRRTQASGGGGSRCLVHRALGRDYAERGGNGPYGHPDTVAEPPAVSPLDGPERSLIASNGPLKWSGIVPYAEEMLQKHEAHGITIDPGYGVEAVLVGPQGIAVPFLTEFCANSEETQQDSELKAFRGLAKRMKAPFPTPRLILLADG